MSLSKAYILTEGSKHIGFGHITRCTSLCQALVQKGVEVRFLVNGDETVANVSQDTGIEQVNWLEQNRSFADAELVIVDSYLAQLNFYQQIVKQVKLAVFIDDNKRLKYPGGIVVNGSAGADKLGYPENNGVSYLLGPGYIPLRQDFWQANPKEQSEKLSSVMITFGGDDLRGLTGQVLEQLAKNYPELTKNIVIGQAFSKDNIAKIKAVADEKTELSFAPGAAEIKDIMCQSDIAVSASGQTLYELARIGVPTIAIGVVDNQLTNISGWRSAGFIEYAGWWSDQRLIDSVLVKVKLLQDQAKRVARAEIGRSMVDGQGALRVVEKLNEYSLSN
ncbi:PseG/SpsG family protein [Candidatus Margulisiibacteriota bacterium]